MNINKIIKLLNLTTSSNENEALNAIRMANLFIQAHSTSWSELLTKPMPAEEFEEYRFSYSGIENLFNDYDEFCHQNNFIDRLRAYFEDKEFLTRKQYDSLKKYVCEARKFKEE